MRLTILSSPRISLQDRASYLVPTLASFVGHQSKILVHCGCVKLANWSLHICLTQQRWGALCSPIPYTTLLVATGNRLFALLMGTIGSSCRLWQCCHHVDPSMSVVDKKAQGFWSEAEGGINVSQPMVVLGSQGFWHFLYWFVDALLCSKKVWWGHDNKMKLDWFRVANQEKPSKRYENEIITTLSAYLVCWNWGLYSDPDLQWDT